MSSTEYQDDVPSGIAGDNDYASRTGQSEIPVQKDEASVEDPINPDTADSDATLEQDEKAAMDESNILDGSRTRHAQPAGSYQEPGDEEGLPGPDNGRSAVAQ